MSNYNKFMAEKVNMDFQKQYDDDWIIEGKSQDNDFIDSSADIFDELLFNSYDDSIQDFDEIIRGDKNNDNIKFEFYLEQSNSYDNYMRFDNKIEENNNMLSFAQVSQVKKSDSDFMDFLRLNTQTKNDFTKEQMEFEVKVEQQSQQDQQDCPVSFEEDLYASSSEYLPRNQAKQPKRIHKKKIQKQHKEVKPNYFSSHSSKNQIKNFQNAFKQYAQFMYGKRPFKFDLLSIINAEILSIKDMREVLMKNKPFRILTFRFLTKEGKQYFANNPRIKDKIVAMCFVRYFRSAVQDLPNFYQLK